MAKTKATAVPFDITEMDKIPNFVTNIIKTHTDLDCVLLNSGIQRGFDFTKPESIDMSVIETEFKTNYLSFLALTKAFLPFLQSKKEPSALIYTTSGLALVPILRCPNYCASKAALHHFILVLREQLKGSNVRVVELYPPAVQTEIHDEKHQPDIKNGGQIGMPLDRFTEEAYAGLAAGDEQVPVGMSRNWYDSFEPQRQQTFQKLVKMMGGKP
ncbi:MAG: hypothetical protein M1830_000173 [Pleopsidium flavum]|nr:MAG: hypothetical protein M1830_000173 [Pleopsidium flavum]